jgi:hypothetical protein
MLSARHQLVTIGRETAPGVTTLDRRSLLALLSLGGAACLWSRSAGATLARGLTLEVLANASDRIVVGTAILASSRWEDVGGTRRIVTDTRVRIEDVVSGPADSELFVRTHGGRVGKVGERVHGEPELVLNEPFLAFLVGAQARHYVTGMAQGHYPLAVQPDRARYVTPSPRLPELVRPETSAVRRLAGRELAEAKALIQKARVR